LVIGMSVRSAGGAVPVQTSDPGDLVRDRVSTSNIPRGIDQRDAQQGCAREQVSG
jgi:hypothetical protein